MTPSNPGAGRPKGTVEEHKRAEEKRERVRALRSDLEVDAIELPLKIFMYTLDQIAYMLDTTEESAKKTIIYFKGRDIKLQHRTQLKAVNIASVDKMPIWRVHEAELIRWCKIRKITFTRPVDTREIIPARPRKPRGGPRR